MSFFDNMLKLDYAINRNHSLSYFRLVRIQQKDLHVDLLTGYVFLCDWPVVVCLKKERNTMCMF